MVVEDLKDRHGMLVVFLGLQIDHRLSVKLARTLGSFEVSKCAMSSFTHRFTPAGAAVFG
jgi:hypothetical protein